jgi:hypothetical protein
MVRILLFGHRTQGNFFCYLSNIKYIWNNLSAKYWITQIMLIFMVVVIFHMCLLSTLGANKSKLNEYKTSTK